VNLKLLLLLSLITITYLLIAIQGIVEIFSIKVAIASNVILQSGNLTPPKYSYYWLSIALMQNRPVSTLLISIISIVTSLQPICVILIPSGLVVTVLVTYLIARNILSRTSILLLLAVSTSLLPYFTVTSYHSLSMTYLVLFLYIIFFRNSSSSFTYKNFVLGSVLLLNTLLTHQYASGIALLTVSIYLILMSGLSIHKTQRQRNLVYILASWSSLLILSSLLEIYYLKDLELLSTIMEGKEFVASLIDNAVYTIVKALRIVPAEQPPHQKYADAFYETFPSSKYQSLVEGFSKYFILVMGLLLSTYFLRSRSDEKDYTDSKALAASLLSLCGGILGVSLAYSAVYKGAVILYQYVALYVLPFTQILLYSLFSKSSKFINLLLRAMSVLLFILMLLNNVLFLVVNVDLANKGIIPLINENEVKQAAVFIAVSADVRKLAVLADFAVSSIMGFTIYSHNYSSQINVMPLGNYTYLLECSSYTEIANILAYPKLAVLTNKNLLYGMRGEVAQYYVPPNKICYKGFVKLYHQVIATNNLFVYYLP